MTSYEVIQTLYRIAAGGIALGVLIAFVIASVGVKLSLFTQPNNIVPSEPNSDDPGDPAWLTYIAKQIRTDLRELLTQQVGLFLRLGQGRWAEMPYAILSWPVLVVAALSLVVFSIVFSIAFVSVQLTAGLAVWLGVVACRMGDAIYSKLKQADASCPRCFEVMARPAYVCPECGVLHRDIRAGRLGALFRSCKCGHRLPTGVLRAALQLDAVCQHCGANVHRGAVVLQDVRIPVFGDPHAGKTRLILAGIRDLFESAKADGIGMSFADESSKLRGNMGLDLIADDQRTVKTDWKLEAALTCQIGDGATGALLHVFDAAGERFQSGEGHDGLRYMDDGHTLVFVVDPFAVPSVRNQLRTAVRIGALSEHLPEKGIRNPEGVYGEVVSRIKASGVDTKDQRLAVVVTKADVLASAGLDMPSESEALQSWLFDGGLHNVVLAAGQEFREVRYFAVASAGTKQTDADFGPSAPFVWALGSRRVKFPGANASLHRTAAA